MKIPVQLFFTYSPSPFGNCLLVFHDETVYALYFLDHFLGDPRAVLGAKWQKVDFVEDKVKGVQLMKMIFLEKSKKVKMCLAGTDFQCQVWEELQNIPPGKTITYLDLAQRIGKPKAVRAVANAVGDNEISYLIPCHRVLRTDGGLGGYRWGISCKRKLLEFEGVKV